MMLHLLVAISVTGLVMLFGYVWSEHQHLKKLIRRQEDELSMMKRDIMGIQSEVVWRNPLQMKSRRFSPSDVKSAKQTLERPGEVDQELLLR